MDALKKLLQDLLKHGTVNTGAYVKGIGAIPEGIANNPVVYDMIFDAAWRPEKFNVKDWLT